MYSQTEGLVLKTVRYSDTNSILHLYTEDFGSVSVLVSRARGRSAARSRALLAPLSLLQLTLDYRANREIQRVKEYSVLLAPRRPSVDPVANALALFLTELLDRLLYGLGEEASLFRFVREGIRDFEEVPREELPSFHLFFMTALTHPLGIRPDLSLYRPGYLLDPMQGCFRPRRAEEPYSLAEAADLMQRFFTEPEPLKIPLGREQRRALLTLLLQYYKCHYPGVGNLKSPEVLGLLFA